MPRKNSRKNTSEKIIIFLAGAFFVATAWLINRYLPGYIPESPDSRPVTFGPTVKIKEVNYPANQKISTGSKLYMSFPGEMDKTDVSANLEKPEGMEGEINWDGSTLIFSPEKELEEEKSYTFRSDRSVKYATGAPLNKDLEFQFTVVGPPAVSSHYPVNDATEIPDDSKITIIFDRPMIPLSAVQGSGAKKYSDFWPVTLSPEVKGEWRWLGTSAVQFASEKKLTKATMYTVNVPAGITSVIGDETMEKTEWAFTTERPKVVSAQPESESGIMGPQSGIIISFNQKIGLEEVINKIRLYKNGNSGEEMAAFDAKYFSEEIDGKNVTDEKKVIVSASPAFELNTGYQLVVPEGMLGEEGNLGTEKEFKMNFQTAGEPEVKEGKFESNQIKIVFSNPVNNETLKGNVTIMPEVKDWETMEMETSSWSDNTELFLYPALKPSTEYTVRVSGNIMDQFGQKLKPYTLKFTTPKTNPSVNILSKNEFGIFENERPPVYSFESVNVSKIDIEFARVPFNEFIKIRKNIKDNWQYQPNLANFLNYKTFTIETGNKLNEWETSYFEIEKELGIKLGPGIYAISIKSPEYKRVVRGIESPVTQYQYFSLTNTALTLKYSGGRAFVWAVDMQTGEAAEDVNISLYNLSGVKRASGTTDENGFFETDINIKDFEVRRWNEEIWVTGTKGSNFTFLSGSWNSGIRPWNFGIGEDFHGPSDKEYRLDSYIYTERQVYRAGDTVNIKGILRLRDKNGDVFVPKKNRKAVLRINDAQYNEIFNKTLDINEFGSFTESIPIDPEAPLGNYSVNVQVTPEDDIDSNYGYRSFYVLAYRKPEYKVEVTPKEKNYFSDDKVEFDISGNYYFGAPMSDAEVMWRANSADYWFNRYTDDWYSFALDGAWCWWECESSKEEITEGKGMLNSDGNYEASFPVNLDDKSTSQIVTLHADITDSNNQVVSSSESVPVHKAGIYVGIKNTSYSVPPNSNAEVKVITVNPDGTPAPREKVTLKLFSRKWNTIKKKSVDGYYYYENEPEDTFIRDTDIKTGSDGKAVAQIKVDDGGSYRIIAEVKDSKGRIAKAGTGLYVYSATFINWPHQNHDRIDVIADKPQYSVGDTAQLLIKSPYQGENVKALITVERENIITKKVINVTGNAQPIEIPITEDLIPNAYVSAVIIKPRDGELPDENGNDTGMPKFKIGYAKLKVETERKKLDVKLSTDKKKYGPGETVNTKIRITDYKGQPVKAEVSLGVVDMSVEALLGFSMPDLIAKFYENRGLGVRTAEMLSYVIEAFKPGSKGGGGGDTEMRARSDFKDTAYWNPDITTDENGEAEVSFTLPDNLTTWHLLAIAHTKDSLYGAQDHEIIETKQVILRPVRPRFAVMDDEIKIGAIVHNFTDRQKDFEVTLEGEGFTGQDKKTLTLKPDENKKVIFPVTISQVEKATFKFKAAGEGAQDEITESIPVYVFGTPQSVATSGVTEKEAMEKVWVPAEKEAKDGKLTAVISPTVATYLPKGLDYLLKFPYGCAEQTVSSFLGNIALASLQGFDAFRIVDDKDLENNITAGLQKLYTFQRGDGGFGYWIGSRKSYAPLTAYIVHAMEVTRKAGFAVDMDSLSRAKNYLKAVLRNQYTADKIALADRAYILYALSLSGEKDLSLLNNLFEKRQELPVFARAYLAMAYGKGSRNAKTLTEEMLAYIKIDARGAHFEEENESYWRYSMNTNTRTTALALQALIMVTPENEMIPNIIKRLLIIRENGHWDTTQSTITAIFALTDYLKETGELAGNFTAKVNLAGEEKLSQMFNKENILTREEVVTAFKDMKPEEMNSVLISKDGEGKLYYDLSMDYFLTIDQIPPTDQGIGVTREMTSLNPDDTSVKTNGTYKVKLTITVPEERHFVAVSSPLPAGMEAIDFKLKTSQQYLADEVNRNDSGSWWNPLWYFNHTEFRDDSVFLFADYLPAGVYEYQYLARATTPGRFRYRPTRVWEMYYPEIFGQSEGGWIEVRE